MNGTNPSNPDRVPGTQVAGRYVLAGTAVGCVVLLGILWVTLKSVEQHIESHRPRLVWSQRQDWPTPSVIPVTLVRPNVANAQYTYNKPRYRDPGLTVSDEEQNVILSASALAGSKTFTEPSCRDELEKLDAASPTFYTRYLLARWYELNHDTESAQDLYEQAIELAPKVLVLSYTTPKGEPVVGLGLGRVEIGCDRVREDGRVLDQRLVLVYPGMTTDSAGRVYLPVYGTACRPVLLPKPAGYTTAYTQDEGWFNLPSRTGLIRATVRPMTE
ncbi:MAG: hypothetical protein Kow00105_06710 [Phycisphaeraceae bacterium]